MLNVKRKKVDYKTVNRVCKRCQIYLFGLKKNLFGCFRKRRSLKRQWNRFERGRSHRNVNYSASITRCSLSSLCINLPQTHRPSFVNYTFVYFGSVWITTTCHRAGCIVRIARLTLSVGWIGSIDIGVGRYLKLRQTQRCKILVRY